MSAKFLPFDWYYQEAAELPTGNRRTVTYHKGLYIDVTVTGKIYKWSMSRFLFFFFRLLLAC